MAKAIYETKAPGIGTYGNASEEITDESGNVHTVRYSRTTTRRVYAYMSIRRLAGIDESAVTAAVTAAVNDYINNGWIQLNVEKTGGIGAPSHYGKDRLPIGNYNKELCQ